MGVSVAGVVKRTIHMVRPDPRSYWLSAVSYKTEEQD